MISFRKTRRGRVTRGAMALALRVALAAVFAAALPAQQLPQRLSDADFWRLFTTMSEPSGYWRSDNLLSNETSFQRVIPELTRVPRPGVYLGVGPEQNFTYIAAMKPGMAFVFDIRRGNALEMLLYKALFELSTDRADFVSRLFSRRRPPGLDTNSTAAEIFSAYFRVRGDSAFYHANLEAVTEHLSTRHGFSLSAEDRRGIEYVYGAFFSAGPGLDYNTIVPGGSGAFFGGGRRPSYADLMTEDDGSGTARSYLAAESSFRFLKTLEANNLLVPLVGDFAGPKAIRAVGQYLREHGATVGAFYTSNVEQYLFQQGDDWRKFYGNVGSLPLDAGSTFIRAVFNSGVRMPGLPINGSLTLLCPMTKLVQAFREERITSYYDVVQMSR